MQDETVTQAAEEAPVAPGRIRNDGRRIERMFAQARAQVHRHPPEDRRLRGRRRLGLNRVLKPGSMGPTEIGLGAARDINRQEEWAKGTHFDELLAVMRATPLAELWGARERGIRRRIRQAIARLDELRGRRCGAVQRRALIESTEIRIRDLRRRLANASAPTIPAPAQEAA